VKHSGNLARSKVARSSSSVERSRNDRRGNVHASKSMRLATLLQYGKGSLRKLLKGFVNVGGLQQ